MTKTAKRYVTFVASAASLVLATALSDWHSSLGTRFLSYFLLAIFASILKVRLPGIEGTYSFSYFFILLGVADLTLAEAIIIACFAGLAQSVWNAKERPKIIQVLFNLSNLTISVAIAYVAYHFVLDHKFSDRRAILLPFAASVYFLCNTFLVSGILCLMEAKPLRKVWQHWFLWSFPYYVVGCGIASILFISSCHADWKCLLLVLPLTYLVHLYYRLCVNVRTAT